jgi:flavin-dependent dehydrogenase
MQLNKEYDVAIIGGGLAGLATSIQLNRAGHSVVVFEKGKYPFHKVCGEYISLESWNFLEQLGIPLKEMNLPIIDELFLTSPSGKSFTTKLPLGGFGISRYKLDAMLADLARKNGVHLAEETRVDEVIFDKEFTLPFQSNAVRTKLCSAAYGKRSNLDIRWERDFLKSVDKRLDNYVGVKYHIRTNWPVNRIGLHNFTNGYCGISRIENDLYCFCYMTKAEELKNQNNNIEQLQEKVLCRNPHLKKIFENSEICSSFPVTISQINFNSKTQVEDHILMTGDAAGMITPLCGNGMSIALHTAKIASALMHEFLSEKISRAEMESAYKREWDRLFGSRMRTGRFIQRFFGSDRMSNLFVQSFRVFPFLSKPVIKMTHGKSF